MNSGPSSTLAHSIFDRKTEKAYQVYNPPYEINHMSLAKRIFSN